MSTPDLNSDYLSKLLYSLDVNNLPVSTSLINAADVANYIMGAATWPGPDSTYNVCGIANGHAYSILSAFTMTDSIGTAI